jgi:hypothetical protein
MGVPQRVKGRVSARAQGSQTGDTTALRNRSQRQAISLLAFQHKFVPSAVCALAVWPHVVVVLLAQL